MNDFIISNINKLKQKKIPNPEIDLRILLNYSKYKKYKNKNILLSNFVLDEINIKKFNLLLNRRLSKEPISKIINKKSFWKDDFFVNHFVLDPRPETEAIIEESLNIIKNKKAYLRILDIGTGSGAIAISLAREFVNAKIYAIDISIEAIKVAKINIVLCVYRKLVRGGPEGGRSTPVFYFRPKNIKLQKSRFCYVFTGNLPPRFYFLPQNLVFQKW